MVPTETLVYRPVMSRVFVVCYGAFAGWWTLAGLMSSRHVGLSWSAVTWVVTIGAVLYALFWRPAVVVDKQGVVLRNVLRDVWIPWGALEEVQTQYALTLVTVQRRYASWAAGAPGRRGGLVRAGRGQVAGPGSSSSAGAASDIEAQHLPGQEWLRTGAEHNRASRDLRSDSGAAAFMVEQAWIDWRDATRSASERALPLPSAEVRWHLPVTIGVPAMAVLALLATTFGS